MPEKADGSIVISAEVDDKRAQSQLNALEKKVKKLQNSIEDMQSKRSPLVEQMQAYGSELDKAKAKLAELKYMQEQDAEVLSGKTPIGDGSEFMRAKARQSALVADIERQEKEVAKLEKTWADVSKQVGFYDEKIKSAQVEIERASEEAAEIVERTNASAQATENMAKAAKKAESGFSRILKRIKGVAMSAFLFSAAYKGFNALSSYLGRMIKTNEKFADSLARIKGNLLTAFQPIYEAVAPALETMLGLVADVTRGIAQLVSVIFGKSVKSSAEAAKKQYEMSDAIESTGEAAEQAQKSLASFDELNILDTSANADASGVTDAADEIEASFELVEDAATESWVDKLTNSNFGKGFVQFWKKLKGILTPAFETIWDGVTTALGWVIDKILNANPNAIEAILTSITTALGLWAGYKGVSGIITGIKNALSSFAGVLTAHPWLALAAAVSSVVVAWMEYDGYKYDGSKEQKRVEAANKLTKAMKDAREESENTLDTLKRSLQNVDADYKGITDIADKFFDLSQKAVLTESEETQLQKYREQLIEYAPAIESNIDSITGKFKGTRDELQNIIDKQREWYVLNAYSSIIEDETKNLAEIERLIAEAEKEIDDLRADAALKRMESWNAQIKGDESWFNFADRWEATELANAASKLEEAAEEQQKELEKLLEQAAASRDVIDYYNNSINKEVERQSEKSAETAGSTAGAAAGEAIVKSTSDALKRIAAVAKKNFGVNLKIPALATGSVIPPNREFLALVGDNKREPEVVSPLSTIRQAVSEALALSGRTGVGNTTVVLEVDGKELGRVIYPSVQGESARLGTSLTNRYQFG